MLGLAADGVAWAVAMFVAMLLRFEGWDGFSPDGAVARVALAILIAVGISSFVAVVLTGRNGRTLTGSFEDIQRLAICNGAAGVVLLLVDLVSSPRLVPISTCLTAAATATVISMVWRLSVRSRRLRRTQSPSAARAIIFGAGDGGLQIIDALQRDGTSQFTPVVLLDDDLAKRNLALRGVRVWGGRDAMLDVARRFRATALIIAIPSATSATVRELRALGLQAGLEVRVLPPVSELLAGTVGVADVRPVTEVDLLGRAVVESDLTVACQLIRGRRVLITGAAGSIGSEISRQVFALAPAALTLLDRDESALHALQLELEGSALLDSRHLVVADIRDHCRMRSVFDEHRPEIVFHAAALKHLPLLEMHPTEAIKSNVFGTWNVLDCAGAVGVSHFVNISTDKAANPTSVLGASKRLAEGLTAGAAHRFDGTFLSVRFGNVLGSRGTVIDSFRRQVAIGGPVTVTDPDVTRFFMTVAEAVQLVLQAAAFGGDGEVMVLDMGEPVRIADVARHFIAQSAEPIEIVFTGLRPGEKLHEELFNDGEVGERAVHPLIFHVDVPVLDDGELDDLRTVDEVDAASALLATVARCMTVERSSVGVADA